MHCNITHAYSFLFDQLEVQDVHKHGHKYIVYSSPKYLFVTQWCSESGPLMFGEVSWI